ncbi:hypothetical protein NOCA2240063 [metagenome]|uniref:Uncharacterized protein n=1 Tax=metagenome TaxID=256318 RepID=A0A2P2BZX5_9ZZZZ
MATDEQLRSALTEHVWALRPDPSVELATLMRRVRRRRRLRGLAWVAGGAAAIAATWLMLNPPGLSRTAPADPAQHPSPTSNVEYPEGVSPLKAQLGVFGKPAPLRPGRYAVDFLDAPSWVPSAVVAVPAGWGQDDDVMLSTGSAFGRDVRRLELWTVDRVGSNPCDVWPPAIATSVKDLATALQGLSAAVVTRPVPVSVGGYSGVFLRITGTKGPSDCQVRTLWTTNKWEKYQEPRWTDLVWVLDIEGHRVVVNAAYGPAVPPRQIDQLKSMVNAITFTTGEQEP